MTYSEQKQQFSWPVFSPNSILIIQIYDSLGKVMLVMRFLGKVSEKSSVCQFVDHLSTALLHIAYMLNQQHVRLDRVFSSDDTDKLAPVEPSCSPSWWSKLMASVELSQNHTRQCNVTVLLFWFTTKQIFAVNAQLITWSLICVLERHMNWKAWLSLINR